MVHDHFFSHVGPTTKTQPSFPPSKSHHLPFLSSSSRRRKSRREWDGADEIPEGAETGMGEIEAAGELPATWIEAAGELLATQIEAGLAAPISIGIIAPLCCRLSLPTFLSLLPVCGSGSHSDSHSISWAPLSVSLELCPCEAPRVIHSNSLSSPPLLQPLLLSCSSSPLPDLSSHFSLPQNLLLFHSFSSIAIRAAADRIALQSLQISA
uniref:Non-specific serine/threonine protein kinase n=1 Tax=Oryza barthii TaxID=65489 RepID=A0A0D3HHV4_9ORYZ